MTRQSHRVCCGSAVLLLAALCTGDPSARAQSPASTDPQQKETEPRTTLRVTTRLVQVSIIVHDKNGKPVPRLTAADFKLYDNGKDQTIATFSMDSAALAQPAEASAELPPNTFSNRKEVRSGMPTSLTVILLDGLNTQFQDQAYARRQVANCIRQVRPGERIALYAMTSRNIRIIQNFTTNTDQLLRIIDKQKGDLPREAIDSVPEEVDPGSEEMDAWLQAANERMADFYTNRRAELTTSALEALANYLARYPGRKNLIWISSGFPLYYGYDRQPTRYQLSRDRRSFTYEAEKAARAISNANISIYPVDARGLLAAQPFTQRSAMPPMQSTLPGRFWESIDTMKLLAERTGGVAYYNRNDINNAVRSAMDDSQISYSLGYYPAHGTWDGKFHEIKVKSLRSGLRVRHRAGYYAANEQPVEEKERRQFLRDAAASPLDATGLGLTVQANPDADSGKPALRLVVQVETGDLALRLKDGRWSGTLDFLFAPYNAEGHPLEGEFQTIELHLSQENYDRIQRGGLTLRRVYELNPETADLKIIARDASIGATGSVTIPVNGNAKRRTTPARR